MKKLMNTTKVVKAILEEAPETRDSDYLLWLRTIEQTTPASEYALPFAYVVRNINFLGLPNYETISRVRRKLQEKYPELRGTKRKRAYREKNEERFIKFSKANV